MTRRRFFVPSDAIRDGAALLPQDQSHHLRDVLRIGAGEIVEIFDGEGAAYTGRVEFSDSGVTVRGLSAVRSEGKERPLALAAALIKPAKFEWVLQKATELGVTQIIPLKTRRCGIQLHPGRSEQRLERWLRIVREASKQCGRIHAPQIRPPLDYADWLRLGEFDQYSKFLFYEKSDALWQPGMLKPGSGGVVLCVGPEGGWEEGEVAQAEAAGVRVSGLGPWTLRAETASIAALSIVRYHIVLMHSGESICGA
jgi:16S rRNA (uracil1498-N3)-methyltransferase